MTILSLSRYISDSIKSRGFCTKVLSLYYVSESTKMSVSHVCRLCALLSSIVRFIIDYNMMHGAHMNQHHALNNMQVIGHGKGVSKMSKMSLMHAY